MMMPKSLRVVILGTIVAFPLCAALTGEAGADRSRPEKVILVLPFHVATDEEGYEALGEALQELLIADLSSFDEVAVVDRNYLDEILKEHELSLTGLADKDAQIKVGRLAGAHLLLSGTFALVDSEFRINANLFEIATSRLACSREVTGRIDEWLQAEQELARKLADDLNLDLTNVQALAIDAKPRINLHFIRGLGYYYGCKYDHAIMEFLNTLYGDDKYVDARYWMARSYLAQGEDAHACIEFERILAEFPDHKLADKARAELSALGAESASPQTVGAPAPVPEHTVEMPKPVCKLPAGFFLDTMIAFKAPEQGDEGTRSEWRLDVETGELRLSETKSIRITKVETLESRRETWRRKVDKGQVDFERVVYAAKETLNRAIEMKHRMVAIPPIETDKPIAGDRTLVWNGSAQSVRILCADGPVLTDVFVASKALDKEELHELARSLLPMSRTSKHQAKTEETRGAEAE